MAFVISKRQAISSGLGLSFFEGMDILLEVSRRRLPVLQSIYSTEDGSLPTIGGPPARPRANYGGQGSQNSEWFLTCMTFWVLECTDMPKIQKCRELSKLFLKKNPRSPPNPPSCQLTDIPVQQELGILQIWGYKDKIQMDGNSFVVGDWEMKFSYSRQYLSNSPSMGTG